MKHIAFAHQLWKEHLKPSDWAIDATCGRGKDTLALALLVPEGGVIALDVQEEALESTRARLGPLAARVSLHLQSHATFPAVPHPIKIIIYNLGYLPGGDQQLTTQTATTLASIGAAQELLAPGGLICITCYPGHPEGQREAEALLQLPCTRHTFSDRSTAPFVLIIKK